jgi:hypothetical protein
MAVAPASGRLRGRPARVSLFLIHCGLDPDSFFPAGPVIYADDTGRSSRVMEETAPLPIFRSRNKPTLYGVVVHIVQFFGFFRFTPGH